MGSPSGVCPVNGAVHNQIPYYFENIVGKYVTLVQGLILGPTPKPEDLSSKTRFKRYDFPVLYIPATEITPIFPLMELRKSIASLLIVNSIQIIKKNGCLVLLVLGSTDTSGIASSL